MATPLRSPVKPGGSNDSPQRTRHGIMTAYMMIIVIGTAKIGTCSQRSPGGQQLVYHTLVLGHGNHGCIPACYASVDRRELLERRKCHTAGGRGAVPWGPVTVPHWPQLLSPQPAVPTREIDLSMGTDGHSGTGELVRRSGPPDMPPGKRRRAAEEDRHDRRTGGKEPWIATVPHIFAVAPLSTA